MHATETFARFARHLAEQPLPGAVLHHAQRAVNDWYASLYPGLDMPAVQVLQATLADDLDRGDARLACGRAATVRAAALIHGTAAHAAEGKLLELASPVIGEPEARALLARIWALPTSETLP